MKKSETIAYNFLLKRGYKPDEIKFNSKTPFDFETPDGYYEAKTILNKNEKAIRLTDKQVELVEAGNDVTFICISKGQNKASVIGDLEWIKKNLRIDYPNPDTKLVGVVLPMLWIEKIENYLNPMETIQDYIREAIETRLKEEKRIK